MLLFLITNRKMADRPLEEVIREALEGGVDAVQLLLGVSVHNIEEAIEAEKYGADYIIAGHIYETESKKCLEP